MGPMTMELGNITCTLFHKQANQMYQLSEGQNITSNRNFKNKHRFINAFNVRFWIEKKNFCSFCII